MERFLIWLRLPPAVDAEPVRHGRWILRNVISMPYKIAHECSCCREWGYFATFEKNYCPNCGAKMDGKECVPRKCGTCSNDGWDMPQCRECNEENGFKIHRFSSILFSAFCNPMRREADRAAELLPHGSYRREFCALLQGAWRAIRSRCWKARIRPRGCPEQRGIR